MTRYVIRRLLQAVVLVFASATIVAFLIHLIPGDPVSTILGDNYTTAQAEEVRTQLGLDRPIYVQYGEWLGNVARGDFGRSLTGNRPISDDLVRRIPRTLELIVASTFFAVVIGVPAGVIAAQYRNRGVDLIISFLALVGVSVPVFVTGTLFVLIFGIQFDILPGTGYVAITEDPWGHFLRLILPSITLAILMAAIVIRMTRSSLLEVLGEDYVRTARAKGLANRVTLFGHALRNPLIPVITVVGLQMGNMLGGTVLVEFIFNWPGLSTYLITAINQRDYPVVQAVVLIIAVMFILLNLLTDLLYAVIDPRIKYE
jgi:peptide/nickel transport system permease protein